MSKWLIIYATNDFNWSEQKLNENSHQKILFFYCVCIKWMYKLQKKHGKNVVLKHLFIIAKKKNKWIVVKNERHSNTTWAFKYCWCCVKENQKILRQKKQKRLQKKKNKNTKHFLKVKRVFLLLKKLHVM